MNWTEIRIYLENMKSGETLRNDKFCLTKKVNFFYLSDPFKKKKLGKREALRWAYQNRKTLQFR